MPLDSLVGVVACVRRPGFKDRLQPGPDDGLVLVQLAKVEGMIDFIIF